MEKTINEWLEIGMKVLAELHDATIKTPPESAERYKALDNYVSNITDDELRTKVFGIEIVMEYTVGCYSYLGQILAQRETKDSSGDSQILEERDKLEDNIHPN